MLSPMDGWASIDTYDAAIDDFAAQIVHTQDGGKTWSKVTPAKAAPLPRAEHVTNFFLDNNHAWAAVSCSRSDDRDVIWRTADGGQSWTGYPLGLSCGDSDGKFFDFVDATHGWLLETDCCAMGNEPAVLYQTVNGGITWQPINAAPDFVYGIPALDNAGNLPDTYHTGIVFENRLNGWMTLASIAGDGGLIHTTDAGRNWVGINLPNPPNHTLEGCDLVSPQLFKAGSLMFIAACWLQSYKQQVVIYLYHTENDGKTWEITLPDVPLWNPSGFPTVQIEMLNPSVGWAYKVDSETNSTVLYQTLDGGTHWTQLSTMSWLGIGGVLDFIDQNTGWAIDQSTWGLQFTANGGKTWMPVNAQIGS